MNKIYSIAVALMASSILMVGCGKQSTSNSLKGVNPENATNGFALKGSAPIAVLTNALGVGYGAVTITNSLTCTNVFTFSAGGILTGWTHTP